MSAPAPTTTFGHLHRVVRLHAARRPVHGGDAHRERLGLRPLGADPGHDLQRVAHPVGERAAVLVGAPVGERRDERRQQIAVRQMQLEQVEPGGVRHLRRRERSRRRPGPCRRGSSPAGRLVVRAVGDGRRRDQRPVALRAAARPPLPTAPGSSPSGRRATAGCRSWPRSPGARTPRSAATRRRARADTCRRSRVRSGPRGSRRSSRSSPARRRRSRGCRGAPGASRSAARPRRGTGTSRRPRSGWGAPDRGAGRA